MYKVYTRVFIDGKWGSEGEDVTDLCICLPDGVLHSCRSRFVITMSFTLDFHHVGHDKCQEKSGHVTDDECDEESQKKTTRAYTYSNGHLRTERIRYIDEHVTEECVTHKSHWWSCITDARSVQSDTTDFQDMSFTT